MTQFPTTGASRDPRPERLLGLLQLLRQYRRPVAADTLAERLCVSRRTLYRDIAALRGQGAPIEGEAGIGYRLRPGFLLPPLMFSEEEVEALVLGARWVGQQGDARLAAAARSAQARIAAVLPDRLRDTAEATALLVPPRDVEPNLALPTLREAIRGERTVALHYRTLDARESRRTVWPLAIGFFEGVQLLVAWCELRRDFRHFRIDRIVALDPGGRMPERRAALLRRWRTETGVPAPDDC